MTIYLTIEEVVIMHEILIQKFGGSLGLRDKGALEAAVYRPQSGYYSDVIAQAAALFESLAINHPFVDGNKRIAFAAMDVFLRMNDCKFSSTSKEAYQAIITMFENKQLDFEHVDAWVRSMIRDA